MVTVADKLLTPFYHPTASLLGLHYLFVSPPMQLSNKRAYFQFVCSAAAIIISIVVLADWYFDVESLKSILPNSRQMKPNTAVAFVLAGIGLCWVAIAGRYGQSTQAAVIFGIPVFLIGSSTLAEYITGFSFGTDILLLPASGINVTDVFPGRMSPNSAFNFALLGISLTLLNGRRQFGKASEFFAILISITTYAAVLGYLYGAEQLFSISIDNSMALPTAGLFFLCSFALLAANKDSSTAKILTADSLGGTAARGLLPAVILIPTLMGWLRIIGQERGLFDTGFGAAATIFTSVVLMFGIIFFFCSTVHQSDQRRKIVEHELTEKEQRFHELFDYSQGMICIHDLQGVMTTINPAALSSLGYEEHELIGANMRDLLPDKRRPQFTAYLREVENNGISNGYLELIAKTGNRLVWRYHNILVSEIGKEPYVLGHAQDVTELLDAQKQLRDLSLTDELTGIYNRRGFLALAEQQIRLERHEKTARGLTLLFADMDGLKAINDQYGHNAGSKAIADLALLLKSVVRGADLVARWGGDEFVLLTIGSDDDDAEPIVDRIQQKLATHNAASDKPYKLACSIGIASVSGTKSIEDTIAEADFAMYADKRRKKAERGDSAIVFPFPSTNPVHTAILK